MTIARMLMAAFCALAAGVFVEHAKATSVCTGADAKPANCIQHSISAER